MSRLSPAERFEVARVARGDGHAQALVIRCVTCDAVGEPPMASTQLMPTDQALKKFERLGWSFQHNNKRFDKCPDCTRAASVRGINEGVTRQVRAQLKALPMDESKSNVAQLRTPTMEDRRRILEELQAAYDPTRKAYVGELSDEKLAAKLSVPRAWVSDIRSSFFGPDTNEAMLRVQGELVAWLAKLKDIEERALGIAGEAETARREVAALMKKASAA